MQEDDGGVKALTPGHFLIGRTTEALTNSSQSFGPISLLRRWHLCQALTCHFWQCWSKEYFVSLRHFSKWHHPSKNLMVGDVVLLCEDNVTPAKWQIVRVTEVYPGDDKLVRVLMVKTANEIYRRPVVKTVLLLSSDNSN